MAQLIILYLLRRKRNALAANITRHNINRSHDSHSFVQEQIRFHVDSHTSV